LVGEKGKKPDVWPKKKKKNLGGGLKKGKKGGAGKTGRGVQCHEEGEKANKSGRIRHAKKGGESMYGGEEKSAGKRKTREGGVQTETDLMLKKTYGQL